MENTSWIVLGSGRGGKKNRETEREMTIKTLISFSLI